jgi:hypothetical protein
MERGKLTEHEAAIIHRLLTARTITDYEIIALTPEGRDLPGASNEYDIEMLSGIVVTATHAYSFWLDWIDGNYVLNYWHELDMNTTPDRDAIFAAQRRLQETKETST